MMSNDAVKPVSDDEVVALAKAAIEQSREDINQRAVTDTPQGGPRELQQQQPGITIDLGHNSIARLPDEVIDVIRSEIERLALSHNLLTTLPLRLIECKRLRYLNVRYNAMREIPEAILGMTSLEILDVSRNRITVIPPKIANLTSLKVLAIAKNRIEELPLCLGDINSLQVLKLDGNPLRFPPADICTIKDNVPSPANENERDAVIATQVKKYMRLQSSKKEKQRTEIEKLKVESSGDESWTESNPETPRPSRRANGGRFPVKPSIGSADGFSESRPESPGIPPPIPTRSHYRVASQQSNGSIRRPAISPLMLTNGSNERNRSQSEGAGSASHRQKRMGIYTNKTSELGSVDETKRTSHFRGFSQGYVLPENNASSGMPGPASAIGYGDTVRPLTNRPLSDVREHKRGSRAPDVVVEAAKNFLYAISQLHDPVSHMVRSVKRTDRSKDGLRRKEDFYRRFSSLFLHVRALSQLLNRFDTLAEEDEEDAQKLSQHVYTYTLKCLDLFLSINLSIAENRAEITHNAEPRFVRTFLFLQQGSLIEMRNACAILGAEFRDIAEPSRGPSRNDAGTVRARPLKARRFQTSPPQRNGHYQMPPPVILNSNDSSRTNTLTSLSAATPRSGESFSTLATMSRANTLTSSLDEAEEDAQFERIYAKLRTACDTCRNHIPQILRLLKNNFENLRRELDSDDPKIKVLAGLIEKCNFVHETTNPLAQRLSQMQLKDSQTRNQPMFWQQCMSFIKAWGELAAASGGDGRNMGLLNSEVKQLMKPLHRTVKEASLAINDSPWSHLTSKNPGQMAPPSLSSFTSRTQPPKYLNKPTMQAGMGPSFPGPINTSITTVASAFPQPYSTSSIGSGSGGYVTPVPATPLSAALGAAAQATVPNTPNHPPVAPNSTFNVFERADRLLSQTARRV